MRILQLQRTNEFCLSQELFKEHPILGSLGTLVVTVLHTHTHTSFLPLCFSLPLFSSSHFPAVGSPFQLKGPHWILGTDEGGGHPRLRGLFQAFFTHAVKNIYSPIAWLKIILQIHAFQYWRILKFMNLKIGTMLRY